MSSSCRCGAFDSAKSLHGMVEQAGTKDARDLHIRRPKPGHRHTASSILSLLLILFRKFVKCERYSALTTGLVNVAAAKRACSRTRSVEPEGQWQGLAMVVWEAFVGR